MFFYYGDLDLITARDAPIHIFPLPIPVHEFGYLQVPIRVLFALILASLLISYEAVINKHV